MFLNLYNDRGNYAIEIYSCDVSRARVEGSMMKLKRDTAICHLISLNSSFLHPSRDSSQLVEILGYIKTFERGYISMLIRAP